MANKAHIKLCDIEIAFESDTETMEQIVTRAANGIAFLVQERLKMAHLMADIDQGDAGDAPPEPSKEIIPAHEQIQSRAMYA